MPNWLSNLIHSIASSFKKAEDNFNVSFNFGLVFKELRETDWVSGIESGIRYAVNLATGNWAAFLPDSVLQVLNDGKNRWETNACTEFSAANIIKTQLNWMLANGLFTQEEIDYYTQKGYILNGRWSISARFIALTSNNDPARGNTLVNVWDAIREHQNGSGFGLVPEVMCPSGNSTKEFYTPLTQDVIDYGKNFFKYLQVNYEFIYNGKCNPDINVLKYHLKQAPLQIASSVCAGWFGDSVVQAQPICVSQHATEIFNIDDIIHDFDSETSTPRKLALNYPITSVLKAVVSKKQPIIAPNPVTHLFVTNMEVGDKNSPEVVLLQNKLKKLGFFPLNVDSTGNYGPITRMAVEKFQHSVGIYAAEPGRYCWIGTRTALNKV